jgi:hypothetical protein
MSIRSFLVALLRGSSSPCSASGPPLGAAAVELLLEVAADPGRCGERPAGRSRVYAPSWSFPGRSRSGSL